MQKQTNKQTKNRQINGFQNPRILARKQYGVPLKLDILILFSAAS
jgi:hypothetical protein